MKAMRVGAPGQVVWAEQDEPQIGPGEVLLQPLACGICSSDIKMVRRGQKDGGSYALGHELVGRIIATGNGVKAPIGQRVVAAPYVPCGACPSVCAANPPRASACLSRVWTQADWRSACAFPDPSLSVASSPSPRRSPPMSPHWPSQSLAACRR